MKEKANNSLIAVDLFSGCGGLSLGLKKAGFDVRAAVEIDKDAINTYSKNLGEKVIEKDIRNLTGQELMEKAGITKDQLFLLAGCPPCQGFSRQRNPEGKDNDPRNTLVFEYVRLIKETKPAFILMENVPGMTTGFGKKIFDMAIKDLESDYYIIYNILNAADYGVPQIRKRLVVHGVRKDIHDKYLKDIPDFTFSLPVKTHVDPTKKTQDKRIRLKEWETARAIQDLPQIKAGQEYVSDKVYNHKSQALAPINIERIRYIRDNGGSRDCLPERLQLTCHKKHSGHKDVYGIMSWDKPAPTMTGGCLCYSKGRYGHPEQDRAISVREAARLQTFPDSFKFFGTFEKMGLQIGNAVPVKLAQASGKVFKRCLEIIKENEEV